MPCSPANQIQYLSYYLCHLLMIRNVFMNYSVFRALLVTMKKMLIAYDGSDASKKALDMVTKCSNKDDEVTLLSLVGRIDMNTISTLSGTMKIHGMDKLDKMDK